MNKMNKYSVSWNNEKVFINYSEPSDGEEPVAEYPMDSASLAEILNWDISQSEKDYITGVVMGRQAG